MEDRIQRALSQRLYLLEKPGANSYRVAGLTNHYTVTLAPTGLADHTCTCPDFTRRLQACKHVIFVLLRVCRLKRLTDVPTEVEAARVIVPQGRQLETEDPECPICYEEFLPDPAQDEVLHCFHCGHRFHISCEQVWRTHQRGTACPLCRHEYMYGPAKKKKK